MGETTTLAPLTVEEATGFLDKLVSRLSDFAVTYGMRLVVAVLLLIVGFKLSGWLVKLYKQSKLYKRLDATVRSFLQSILFAIGAALGFALAMILMAGIREKVDVGPVPKCFQGLPIAFITAGLMSLAFMGFAGLIKG